MKNKKVLYSILIVVALIAIGVGAFLLISGQKKSNKTVLTEAIKTRTNGIKKLMTDRKSSLGDKTLNLKLDLNSKDLKGAIDSYIKGEEVYMKLNFANELVEAYVKDDKIYFRSPNADPQFYFMDLDLDVSDDKVDDVFEDVKEEDIKKEEAEITIKGKTFKTVKYSYELTEKQMKEFTGNTANLAEGESGLNVDKALLEMYLYEDEAIKMQISVGKGQDKKGLVFEEVEIDDKQYLSISVQQGGIKAGELKVEELTKNNFDIRLTFVGQELFGGKMIKEDNRVTLNLKDTEGTMSLDLVVNKVSDTEYDANLSLLIMDEKIDLTGNIKEVSEMPKVDVSNAKSIEESEGIFPQNSNEALA